MSVQTITSFEVNSDGILQHPDVPQPLIRAQVYERIDLGDARDCEGLVELIRRCEPLTGHFQRLGQNYLAEHGGGSNHLNLLDGLLSERTGSQRLILRALREDPDDGWERWIKWSGAAELEYFQGMIQDWLDEEIDWSEREFFDSLWNGQVAAFGYFMDLPRSALNTLGICFTDSEQPGSAYQLVELHKGIDVANQAAERLGLSCRFHVCDESVQGAHHD